ncbi:sarcosine oxidase subunit gamma [uncultured Roseovarius sp.]|uniref:sarcosine oxidase subunit gamma n=1 Tax=uncultured Roseovarius sp. TaxID=293344 RepID=UPI0026391196|nr:sarcosine oxidase subunit gamma [uncultured Roseovarius sp.]
MHDLVAITPLGAVRPKVDSHGPVTLTEVTDRALASVAARLGHEAETATALERLLGAPAPGPARHGGKSLMAFWMGPEQWMVEASFETHEDLARQIGSDLGAAASVTEQTDAWCRFDLTGDGLADVFERLTTANVRAFEGGEAQRASVDHMGCFVLCHDARHISVLGPRSSAGSLHHALLTAMRSAH